MFNNISKILNVINKSINPKEEAKSSLFSSVSIFEKDFEKEDFTQFVVKQEGLTAKEKRQKNRAKRKEARQLISQKQKDELSRYLKMEENSVNVLFKDSFFNAVAKNSYDEVLDLIKKYEFKSENKEFLNFTSALLFKEIDANQIKALSSIVNIKVKEGRPALDFATALSLAKQTNKHNKKALNVIINKYIEKEKPIDEKGISNIKYMLNNLKYKFEVENFFKTLNFKNKEGENDLEDYAFVFSDSFFSKKERKDISKLQKYLKQEANLPVEKIQEVMVEIEGYTDISDILKYAKQKDEDGNYIFSDEENYMLLSVVNNKNEKFIKELLSLKTVEIFNGNMPEDMQYAIKVTKNKKLINNILILLGEIRPRDYKKTVGFIKSFKQNTDLETSDILRLPKLNIENPEEFQKIKESGLLKLIEQGDIAIGILDQLGKNTTLAGNVYDDIKKVVNNEPIVPEFSKDISTTEIIEKTKVGDVVEKDGKLYINNENELIEWKMTKQKYLELFPPIERFSFQQGDLGDCYLISPMDLFTDNPKARVHLYKRFRQDGEDIYVNVPASRTTSKEILFEKDELRNSINTIHVDGPKGIRMLEQAYAEAHYNTFIINSDIPSKSLSEKEITALNVINAENASDEEVKSAIESIASGGSQETVLQEFFPDVKVETIYARKVVNGDSIGNSILLSEEDTIDNKQELKDRIEELASNPDYIITVSTYAISDNTNRVREVLIDEDYNLYFQHAYAVKGYDKQTKRVIITNPHNSACEIKIPLKVLLKYIDDLNYLEIPD